MSLGCGGPWATAQFAPPLKSGPGQRTDERREGDLDARCARTDLPFDDNGYFHFV